MNEWDYDDDDFIEVDEDPCEREERDFASGVCRECDTWGAFQCRAHGDAHLEAARAENELAWLLTMARRGKHTKACRRARFRLNAMWWAQ